MAKLKTLSEAETARRRAITGLHNLGRDDEADRIDSLSMREYADEKGFEIVENPSRRHRTMARRKTPAELRAENEALKAENEELEDRVEKLEGQLSDITDIVSLDEEDEEDDEEDDDED